MVTIQEFVSQELADAWTLAAQRYAGYFVGHPYRAKQQSTAPGAIVVDRSQPWTEPMAFQDDCAFCQRMTDERVIERIAGYQYAIDIEVVRNKTQHFNKWLLANGFVGRTQKALREFCEETQDETRENRPEGWKTKPIDMTKLPLHLKRRLCIEWNHLLRDWLETNPVFHYDHDAHEVKINLPNAEKEVLAADPEEQAALEELLAEDHAYAETTPPDELPSRAEQIADEYEAGLW